MDDVIDYDAAAERRGAVAADQLDAARGAAAALVRELEAQGSRLERARLENLRLRDERDRHRQNAQFLAERVRRLEQQVAGGAGPETPAITVIESQPRPTGLEAVASRVWRRLSRSARPS